MINQIAFVTYFSKEDNMNITKKAIIIKDTPKTVQLYTRNNELFGYKRTIKKENLVSVVKMNKDDALIFVTSCSELSHYKKLV